MGQKTAIKRYAFSTWSREPRPGEGFTSLSERELMPNEKKHASREAIFQTPSKMTEPRGVCLLPAYFVMCLCNKGQILCGGLQVSIERGYIARASTSTKVRTSRQTVEYRSADKYSSSPRIAVLRCNARSARAGSTCTGIGHVLRQ